MPESSDPSNSAAPIIPALPIAVAYGGGNWRDGALPPLADVSPVILPDQTISPDGALLPREAAVATFDAHAVPLRGLQGALTGEWLLESLTKIAWLEENPGYRLCGPGLSSAQTSVLEALGWRDQYMPLTAPARLRAIADVTLRRPPAAIKNLAAKLRTTAPANDARIAILPQPETETFTLANRASLAAWLRAKRFTLVDPEAMKFDDLRATLAAAGTIILADPRQAGILPLCSPTAKIIEIAPAGWRKLTGRLLCDLLGQSLLACDAGPPSYKLLIPLPFGARVPLSYEVPIRDLARLL